MIVRRKILACVAAAALTLSSAASAQGASSLSVSRALPVRAGADMAGADGLFGENWELLGILVVVGIGAAIALTAKDSDLPVSP